MLSAQREPFDGTVEVTNELGLPALPNMPLAADGRSTARVWSNGANGGRVQLPTDGGERTLVSDGTTFWAWNSEDRTVITGPREARPTDAPGAASDPTTAANELLTRLRTSSDVAVGGTAEVAGRSAYELVLTPKPTERTLLREIRIAVDAQKRAPLRVSVLGNGSPDPALQVGFTDLNFGRPGPGAVHLHPAAGRHRPAARAARAGPGRHQPRPHGGGRRLGHGRHPQASGRPSRASPRHPDLSALGTPVSGPWGNGRLLRSAIGNAIVTDDGRIAAGAVPEQLLDEALSK